MEYKVPFTSNTFTFIVQNKKIISVYLKKTQFKR